MKNRFHTLWMSTRIFVRSLGDIHNCAMADRHQAQAYPLRLPDELKERVTAAAEEAGRSLNAEISHRLAKSFEPLPPAELSRFFASFIAGMLVRVVEQLTPEERERFDGLPQARRLAEAVRANDGPEMAEAFADIVQAKDPAEAEKVRALRDDPLIKAKAKK